ncbi:MAG: VanZ family protein [Prevotella sp.]|nr:VanZ family protein [Prevotella sp.]
MKFLFQYIRKYPFSVTCISLVWILSLFPFFPETPLDHVKFIDKWVHFIMYGGTCLVIWLEYVIKHGSPDYEKLFFWAWLAPVMMGGVLELMQAYCTTTRNGDWLDFAANSTGVTLAGIIGLIGSLFYYRFQREKGLARK